MANEEKILEMLGTINDRMGRMETAQAEMNDRLGRLEAAQDKMQAKQDVMQAKQDKMEMDLASVRATLEVEVSLKLRALFDGHATLNEKLDKLNEIEKKLEDVSIRADSAHAAAVVNEYEITQLKQAR